jgi:predicted porin
VGLKYDGEKGDWTYGAAVVTIRESSQLVKDDSTQGRTKLRNTNTYLTSAHLGYGQMKFAGGWMDNGKSRIPVGALKMKDFDYTGMHEGNAGSAWNFGGQYTYGPYQFALVYFQSNRKTDATSKATNDVVTASVDLAALQGLKFFGEVDFITSRTNDNAKAVRQAYLDTEKKGDKAIGNNSGTVFVLGTKLSF